MSLETRLRKLEHNVTDAVHIVALGPGETEDAALERMGLRPAKSDLVVFLQRYFSDVVQ